MEQQGLVFLGVFALIGFLVKAVILANVSIKSRIAECFSLLCLFMMLANAAEFLGYFTYLANEPLGEFFVSLYMVALYFTFPAMLLLTLAMIESSYVKQVRYALFAIAGLVSILHLSGFMVAGFSVAESGWTSTIEPGELYWLAIIWCLVNALSTTALLVYHYLRSRDFEIRNRCKVYLIAFVPILAVAITVPALKAAGFNASTAVSMPIAMITFIFIMLLQTNGNIFWISLKLKILLAVITVRRSDSLDQILGKIEEVRIREALKATNGKQRSAARLLDVPASTLCKKISKYGIQVDEFQTVRVLGGK